MSDQRELSIADCEVTSHPPAAAPRLLQRVLDALGYSAASQVGSSRDGGSQAWDGLEPFDVLRGWQCD
jgi:hypothetical protein